VGVADAADFGEGFVENEVSGEIGGRAKISFYNSSIQIGDDEMFGHHLIVGDAARFYHDEAVFAGDTAGVAKGVEDQSATN
jgi:hypothetical protein